MKRLLHVSSKSKLFEIIQTALIYGLIFNPWTSFPYTFIVISISILLLTYWKDRTVSTIGLAPKAGLFKTIISSIAIFLVLEIVMDFIVQPFVNELYNEVPQYDAFSGIAHDYSMYIKYLLFIWISAAFGEEILFRGFLFKQLNIIIPDFGLKNTTIVLLSSLFFSLPHLYQGTSGLIITFIFGVLFGTIYICFDKNLWVTILSHGLIDTTFITLAYYDKLDYYTQANDLLFGF